MSDLGEEEPAERTRSRYFLKQQISNYVHIVVYNQCSDATNDILLTPAGTYEGGTQVGGRATFVGIVLEPLVMGESSARPSVRMPPLHIMAVHELFRVHPIATRPPQRNHKRTTPVRPLHQHRRGPRL
ncbi:MAG: hypothetical protein ACKPKO_31510, partial [Candidatus Fonsibacter sp.]